jgi:hypothetical protein
VIKIGGIEEYKNILYTLVIGTVAFLILKISGNYGIISSEVMNKSTIIFVPALVVGTYISMKYNLKTGLTYFIGVSLFLFFLTLITDKLL